MTGPAPALAVSGSNAGGGFAFSAAVRTPAGIELALPRAGERADLAVLVQRACAAAGVRCRDIAEVRVDHGPGSYVGLRVAVTLARCLAAFGPARLLTTDSLSLAAAAALEQEPVRDGQRIRPVADGRRERLHSAALRLRGTVLVLEEPPASMDAAACERRLLAGDVVLAPAALIPALAPLVARAGATLRQQVPCHAGHLFAPSLPTAAAGIDELEPLYLMGSYAAPGTAATHDPGHLP